jgi:hypothetical protein
MDWTLAIDRNRAALKRILSELFGMAGLRASSTSPREGGEERFAQQTESPGMGFPSERTVRTRWPFRAIERSSGPFEGFERPEGQKATADALAEPGEGGAPTLPRRLHRAVLRLLRTAESAARRLVIIAARDIVVALPPLRPRQPKPKRKSVFLKTRTGAGIILPRGVRPPDVPALGPRRSLSLPLFDPPRRIAKPRRPKSTVSVPRISVPGFTRPAPLPPPPSPNDPINATRLAQRLRALARALDDLPTQAKRLARWRARAEVARKARLDAPDTTPRGRPRRISPLRTGRPPGSLRRPTHEVHSVLADIHGLAFWVLEPGFDTS